MNLKNKIFSLLFGFLLATTCQAEFVFKNERWQVKENTTSDVTPASDLPRVLELMNQASAAMAEERYARAIDLWNELAEKQQEKEDLDELFKRHSNYVNFGDVIEVTFDVANRLAAGERPHLGGWMPWFKDRLHALSVYEKVIKNAPNGPLADKALIRMARLANAEGRTEETANALERIISDYPNSKFAPEALERLAKMRSDESLGADWDQAKMMAAADHWRTLINQFPNDPRAKEAREQIKILMDRAARARLNLAKFYWFKRNNPEAAKLMANASRSLAPNSEAAREAEKLLIDIQSFPNPPVSLADRILGPYPRPSSNTEIKPKVVGDEMDELGFRKESPAGTSTNNL
ncbi:MAG: outer membrane protein assembly factor BamD [Verrucomicrobia bacterium]|nr:outer membrane protein assembly factor BamD [Verrucomicrobiota bacterium]